MAFLPVRSQYIEVTRSDPADVQWLWAIYQGNVEWTKELIEKGYKVDGLLPKIEQHPFYNIATNRGAAYPIQVAVTGYGGDIVKFLARQGANLKVKTASGNGLILLAYDRPNAVSALLELKADALARDKNGNTILHLAVGNSGYFSEERAGVMRLLADNAKLKKIKNRKGQTAADLAVVTTNVKAVEILAPKRVAEVEKIKAAQNAAIAREEKAKPLAIKWETCGLEGIWFLDKVLAKGLDENNRKLVECALTREENHAHISNNKHCSENNCIFSAKNDQMIDFMISKARKEQLAEIDKRHGSIYTVLGKEYKPGKNDKYMKKWINRISKMGISTEEAQEVACWKGQRDLYLMLGKPKVREGKFSLGQEVGVRIYDMGGKIHTLCKYGASVLKKGDTIPNSYKYSDILTLEEKRAEQQAFAESRRKNDEKRNKKANVNTENFIPDSRSICLSYQGDGSLVCTAAEANKVTCPGEKNWRGPGPCAKYLRKKVSDLPKKQWKDLIWVYNYDVEKRNAPPSSPEISKTDRCRRACIEKKCRQYNAPGKYQESASAGMRCTGFCQIECETNADAYR